MLKLLQSGDYVSSRPVYLLHEEAFQTWSSDTMCKKVTKEASEGEEGGGDYNRATAKSQKNYTTGAYFKG